MSKSTKSATHTGDKTVEKKKEATKKKLSKSAKPKTIRYEDENFVDTQAPVWNYSVLYVDDIETYKAGTHYTLYEKLGSRPMEVLGTAGFYFAVWAPNATRVSVMGSFNGWQPNAFPLYPRLDHSGIWEGFIPHFEKGTLYKYHITGFEGRVTEKGDPFAKFWERRPATSSIAWTYDYKWSDEAWMKRRAEHNSLAAPWSVYEVHLASWMRPDAANEEAYNSWEDITERLIPYVKKLGFTHLELMPVMEHPFDGSWGYQCTGYFAPTSRFGEPEGLMHLINEAHRAGIGVILDWVPSHFPYDAHGLYMFDGTHTYEYADMRKGFHPDWNSYIFNYKRGEVKSFLISSAKYWFDLFHIDGLRVDAVSSMLRLDYSRSHGQWEPNEHGGNGNLEAISFVRELNETIYRDFPDVQMIAEESTDWPGVTKPTFAGGLGFGMKWMMGWMHDTLDYFKMDPMFRKYEQDKFTFSMMYYYDENFLLPISHDEVVHGKSPMLYKQPGDEWQKFANLRTLYAYMWTHPGAKLLFMGQEFGATCEWNYQTELQWGLLQYPLHEGVQRCITDLNALLRKHPAMYENQFSKDGFEWVDLNHRNESVVVYRRKGEKPAQDLLVILNLTPVVRHGWRLETRGKAFTKEIFNSDAPIYGGSGVSNGNIEKKAIDSKAKIYELTLDLPPLSALVLR